MQSRQKKFYQGQDISIPGNINIAVALVAFIIAILCLWQAAKTNIWWHYLIIAVGFSYIGNTIFSLLHECVHFNFHPDRKINTLFGILTSAFFPTAFSLQRAFHLGHHRRNRTDVEMFDMYYQSDSRLLKFLQVYTILLGFYWTSAPIACTAYLLFPGFLNLPILRSKHPVVQHMSADAMISGLDRLDPTRARLEILFTLLFQIGIIWFFDLTFWRWLGLYWAFAINWGGLQYADHAWSKRDIREGAWNLRVNSVVHWIFLHYHHHKAHHQHPQVPWLHLSKFVDRKEERPSQFSIWLKMWKGPTLTEEPRPSPLDRAFEDALYED